MTPTRTLPIRLDPLEGEALDSWLEALAHRMYTAAGDLQTAIGLQGNSGGNRMARWMVSLQPQTRHSITTATGITEAQLTTMTLDHYADRALRIRPDTGTLDKAFAWGSASSSRYCPLCLTDNGGRWWLAWRLGWTFACTRHCCLLVDACPECGLGQRRRPHVSELIPQPGYCANPASNATGRIPERCGADLTLAPTARFSLNHPVIHAQRTIRAVIDSTTAGFGIYRTVLQPRNTVLADIRAIAGRVLAYATPSDLAVVMPADLIAAYSDHLAEDRLHPENSRSAVKPGLGARAHAVEAAVGAVAAVRVLEQTDIEAAGRELRWLVAASRSRGSVVRATNMGWGRNKSPALAGAQLSALEPSLAPSDQLRYRIGSALPSRPRPTADGVLSATRLPSMLWPAWSLRIEIDDCGQQILRPALAIGVLLVGTRLTLDAAAKLMGYPVSGHAVSRVLQLLEKQPHWTSIRTALLRMSECLTKGHVPVDFSRRRRLSYDSLLPDAAWASICKQTGTPAPTPNRANVVRGYLYESISGQSLNMDPRWPSANQFRTNVANFPQHLTQPLAAALDRHAREFLAGQGIRDEPPTWQPPTDILDGLDLPGADPSSVDVAILHTAIRDGISLGAAAQRANTNLGVARYVLSREPGPEADYEPGTSVARVHSVAYRAAAKALPRERFLELYVDGRMSLQDIAETVGASRQTVARLAADYRIKLRAGREPRTTIDRDWLYEQYVGARRALPDLAADAGVSTATMARWATQYEIPLRPRGGPSHSATLRNAEVHAGAPTLLQPALIGIGGWERLRRFAEVSRFATITEAAEHLGIKQGVLTLQINRVERELNRTLYERAQRGHPMRLTHDGHEVVAAVRSYAQNRCG